MYEEPKVNLSQKNISCSEWPVVDCTICGNICFLCILDPGSAFNGMVMQAIWNVE